MHKTFWFRNSHLSIEWADWSNLVIGISFVKLGKCLRSGISIQILWLMIEYVGKTHKKG